MRLYLLIKSKHIETSQSASAAHDGDGKEQIEYTNNVFGYATFCLMQVVNNYLVNNLTTGYYQI